MREIKFRGYRNYEGNSLYPPDKRWIYGYYYFEDGKHWIKDINDMRVAYVVEDGSVGEFTGCKDSTKWEQLTREERFSWFYSGKTEEEWNGKEIYDGDIVQSTSNFVKLETNEPTGKICRETYQIIYVEESAYFTTQTIKGQHSKGYVGPFTMSQESISKYYEVIGNIWENPELLKEE